MFKPAPNWALAGCFLKGLKAQSTATVVNFRSRVFSRVFNNLQLKLKVDLGRVLVHACFAGVSCIVSV